MKGKRKEVALFFAACACMVAISGCGGRTRAHVSAHDVTQSIVFNGYPMSAADQSISWFAATGYVPNQAFATADDSPFHIWLQEMLGVKINWQFPISGTAPAAALNLVLASRNLPNIIYGPLITDAERHIDEGTFWDLTPYIEEWAPAYWKWIQSNPEYARAMRTDKGRYYGFGFFREDGGWNDTYLGPVVNKAWLDELGLPLPVTISDWDRTLRAFRDRYGVGLSFSWDMVGNGTVISGAWGAESFTNFRLFVDGNRRVQIANIQPEYRNQLAQFAEWWRDGLIDQDLLSINNTMARSNALNLRKGLSVTTMGQLSNWIQDARNQGTGAQWIGLQYPTGDDGTLSQVSGGLGIGTSVAVISTSTPPEKLELVMRALDYAYTEEGHLFWNFGKRGVSWDFDANGNPAFLPLVTEDPNGLGSAVDKYAGSTWTGNCIQATALLYMKNSAESIDANNLWFYPNQAVTYPSRLPNLTLTANESTRAGVLTSSIKTYVDEISIQFLTGQAGFDAWDSYVATVRSMGAEELLGIYQAALDRYLAR